MGLSVVCRSMQLVEIETPLLIIPVPKGSMPAGLAPLDAACDGALARCWAASDFSGKKNETALIYPAGKAQRILLVGLDGEPDAGAVRRAAMIAGKRARTLCVPSAAVYWMADNTKLSADRAGQALAEGLPYGAWHYPDFKRPAEDPKPPFERAEIITASDNADFRHGVERGNGIAAGQTFTRGLQMLPGNTCTPEYLGERAGELAARHGFTVTVMDRAAIEAEGMHALLAVGKGSVLEPRFIVLEYKGSADAPVVLVGKGVTFDTGGISIKPAPSMEDMKYDMSGAAAVLGTFEMLGHLKPNLHVVGLIPSAENMPSGTAYKPGDVVHSHFGKTIEVQNTDAEGRLILCDALSWARRLNPAAVVDCATLTGAVVIGLGHTATAVMGTDAPLIRSLIDAGETAGERLWELPLWDDYRDLIKSDIADVKNTGGRPAGSITAGWFLREFVEGYPWAHLDIAGTAYTDRETPMQVRGPTGVLVRLFSEFLLARSA